jgi:peptidoglycan/LPS O-acetylase OafA/YrhL
MNNSLNSFLESRKNNFDIIRFFAAVLVIFSHSYPLTMGHDKLEPLMKLTNNQTGFGHLSVIIFFIISGFLITQSFDKSQNLLHYSKARILRIFPALIVLLLLTVFVLGPLLTTLSLGEYFTNFDTWKYLILNISLIGVQYDLPGVFENNIFPTSVNGSLWTLWFEFFFYIIVAFLGALKILNKKVVLVAFISCLVFSFVEPVFNGNFLFGFLFKYVSLFIYFGAGMLFYLFRNEIKIDFRLALFSIINIIIWTYLGYFDYAFPIFGTYLIFYISLQTKISFHNFTKHGDFSYGLYIFAFPIQQIVTLSFDNQLTPIGNFLFSFPISLILSILSWHLIEKKALMLKKTNLLKKIRFKEAA